MFKKRQVLFIVLIIPCILLSSEVLSSFSSGGDPVYHLKPATVDDSGKRAVISADYSGFVNCHYQDGGFLWRSKVCEGFPFDLEVCDIDGDGLDESLIA